MRAVLGGALGLLLLACSDYPEVVGGDPIHAHNPLEQRWLCLGFDAYQQLLRGEGLGATARERLLQRFGV